MPIFLERFRVPIKEADFLSTVGRFWLLVNDSLVLLCEYIIFDILANNGQEKFSNPFTFIQKGNLEVLK